MTDGGQSGSIPAAGQGDHWPTTVAALTSLQENVSRRIGSRVDFGRPEPTYEWRREKMTTEEMVVDVSQDWVLACDVQQGFMQAPCSVSDS